MTKTTTNLLGIIITILAGTYFFLTYCSDCGIKAEKVPTKETVVSIAPEATSHPFAFSNGDYSYRSDDNFNFNVSSSSIIMPISQNVENGITGLHTFLGENTGKVINITGYYKNDETNGSAFPNLGVARANAVKNYLVSKGVPLAQINAVGELKDNMVPKDNMYLGPVSYGLDGKPADAEDELKELYEKIKANPLVLCFDTGQTSIDLTSEQRQQVADISRYLDKVEGATCKVIGHTDNLGLRSSNIKLGQERANFTKAYLIKNGMAESKILAISEGPDSPIESNATDEGRSKNRRTVIVLTK